MEDLNTNYETYQYKYIDIRYRLLVIIHNYIAAVLNRKDTFKSFCFRNGIDYPPIKDKKYYLNGKGYVINGDEITYLGQIRDQIIRSQYSSYVKCQKRIERELAKTQALIKNQKKNIASEKRYLEYLKKSLNSTDNALNTITIESRIESSKAKVQNMEDDLAKVESHKIQLEKLQKFNISSWQRQVEAIKNATETRISQYVRNVTKHIRSVLNYNEFKYIFPKYGDNVQKIIKGAINVRDTNQK